MGGDIVAQVPGGENIDREDEDFGATGGRFVIELIFDMAIEVIIEKRAKIGEAAWFVDYADHDRIFREGDDDVADIERAGAVRCPEKELMGTRRFALAADDSPDRAGGRIDEIAEGAEQAIELGRGRHRS